jgi:hypothetical protein
MMRKINYHDKAAGCTRKSIAKFHHVNRLGKLFYVKGHTYKGKYGTDNSVVVVGENGRVTFEGLSWGYFGEGCCGLYQLLCGQLGINQEIAKDITYNSKWGDNVGIDWVYSFQNKNLTIN